MDQTPTYPSGKSYDTMHVNFNVNITFQNILTCEGINRLTGDGTNGENDNVFTNHNNGWNESYNSNTNNHATTNNMTQMNGDYGKCMLECIIILSSMRLLSAITNRMIGVRNHAMPMMECFVFKLTSQAAAAASLYRIH